MGNREWGDGGTFKDRGRGGQGGMGRKNNYQLPITNYQLPITQLDFVNLSQVC
ncbi:MAG: hypothetical protein KME31_35715 [Tolypothrix carrinoi HA7290-LM1]|nr:hypothetical protein [Tolypothrix carrinoi HA7290-LM1]